MHGRRAAQVEAWLRDHASARAPAYVDHIVLCELAWVLERSYGYARDAVHLALGALLEHDQLKVESPGVTRQALGLYEAGSADFSDCLLAVRAQAAGYAPVLTFAKKAARTSTHRLLR